MPTNSYSPASRWHYEVPGARWFKADLHLHTLDDPKFERPQGLNGRADDPLVIEDFARQYLDTAIQNGIEVLGLTPHAIQAGDSEISVVWGIVDTWMNRCRKSDGKPYRELIYSVFPGFEPAFNEGKEGLHLLLLFDPIIGRKSFLQAFASVMGAVDPYGDDRTLRLSKKTASDAIADLRKTENSFVVLAPHAFSGKGLFAQMKAQRLADFPTTELAGIELGDSKLPANELQNRPWLQNAIDEHEFAFFHASDAYSLSDIGKRFTYMKLASPTIGALRQAFLASDSRIQIAYEKDCGQNLVERNDLPLPTACDRPWIRAVTVKGGRSLFGSGENGQTIYFSPDLTCIIGSKMSGKSTLLDGLRVRIGLAMPHGTTKLDADVKDRAEKHFLVGNPDIEIDIEGPVSRAAQIKERWSAICYTQRELEHDAKSPETVVNLLYKLDGTYSADLIDRHAELAELDEELKDCVSRIGKARESALEATEKLDRTKKAQESLERFSEADIKGLTNAQHDQSSLVTFEQDQKDLGDEIAKASKSAAKLQIPKLLLQTNSDSINTKLGHVDIKQLAAYIKDQLNEASNSVEELLKRTSKAIEMADTNAKQAKDAVTAKLVELDKEKDVLHQFEALRKDAAPYSESLERFKRLRKDYITQLREFLRLRKKRDELIGQQRSRMTQVMQKIESRFPNIRVKFIQDGERSAFNKWIQSLKTSGITRWVNNNELVSAPLLIQAIRSGGFRGVGMSPDVENSFTSCLTFDRKLALWALSTKDSYEIEFQNDPTGVFKPLDQLSGGAQMSVLLSLILETETSQPLVIDQPEDEIDKRYLFDTLLPALRRLKGRRQVIFATHDPNIVVNGDADYVVHLEATADTVVPSPQGAIEMPEVQDAIISTLDGGQDAFRLRMVKYGF